MKRPWPAELELTHPPANSSAAPHAEPLTLSSVWSMPSLDAAESGMEGDGFVYRRDSHPNARSLAAKLAACHGAAGCVLTAQGMSAIAVAALALLKPGSEVWLARDLYGKTRALFQQGLGPWQIFSRTFDPNSSEDLERIAGSRAELVIVETISNPRLRVTDIAKLAEVAQRVGGRLLVDNTFASHLIARPLELGADLCMESLTKIVSGHSDAMAGMLCARDEQLLQKIAASVSLYGMTSSPLDCYLTTRGLASLPLRLSAACANALALAERLSQTPQVTAVDYPFLATHPQHALARLQLAAGGWMLCIEVAGGRAAIERIIERLAPEIPFCPSLGDIQTTVSHPASTSHRALSPTEQSELGITQGTLRISCGAEPTDWLCDKICTAIGN